MHRPSPATNRARRADALSATVVAILLAAVGLAWHPSTVVGAAQGTIARVTPVEVAARDEGPQWVSNDRLAYVHQTTVVEPERWIVRANLHEVDADGTNDWTGPAVATEYEAMYDYAPVTDTYVYFRNRYLTETPNAFSIGVTGSDDVEHVILGPDPNLGPLPISETFSPDGQHVLFYRYVPLSVASMHVAEVDGSNVVQLLGAGYGGSASFSPDGARIAIGGGGSVGIIDLDGTDGHVIATDNRLNGEVAWSPDGSTIAFAGGEGLFLLDPTGVTAPRLVTSEAVSSPAWSPDGSRLAVTHSYTTTTEPQDEIAIVDADGTGFHDVTDVGPGLSAARPAWSPDGTRIAFDSDMDSAYPANQGGPDVSSSIFVLTLGPDVEPGGTINITSLKEQGGTLDGVAYRITGTTGFDLTVTDGDANDSRTEPGIIGVAVADVGALYTVCPSSIPADWYVQQGCTQAQLQGSPPLAGLAFDYRYIAPLTIDTSSAAPASVPRLGRFEKTFTLSRFYHLQVHDPDVIEVTATFTAPSGAEFVVPAWFGIDYTLRPGTGVGGSELYDPVPITPPAPGIWHVRFSPDEVGTWTYTIRAQDKVPPAHTTVVSPSMSFAVTSSSAKGQIERDPRDDRFLRYADGTPYVPMGHNVAFGDNYPFNDGSHYFEPHFASMAEAGQNWTRVWMTDFYVTALEWSNAHWSGQYNGLGRYADIPAYRIEQALGLAEEYGLEVQLVLNDHGQFSSINAGDRWPQNPYNAAYGGPVPAANPEQFFTNVGARDAFKQRLRYLVARYGAYRSVLAWELFNEVQFVGSPTMNPYTSAQVRDDIVAWHAEMAAYLRSIDPYDHLITTSSDIDSSMATIWDDPNIDLVQVHDYGALEGRDERFRGYATSLNAAYEKPVIIGEFGLLGDPVLTRAPELEFDPETSTLAPDRVAHLTEATHLHNSIWTAAMSASGAMSWWWGNYIRDWAPHHRVAPAFPANGRHNPPLRAFFAGEDLAGMSLDPSSLGAPPSVVALGLDNGSRGFAWVRDALNTYGSGAMPGDAANRTISGATLTFAGFVDGTYRVEVHDPWGEAAVDDSLIATASGGSLVVPLPSFERDIALKIRPGGASPSADLPAGGTLTSDDQGDGPDATDPIVTTVTTPVAGRVSIATSPSTGPPATGFGLVGVAIDLAAPSATAVDPLVLVFRIDASAVPAGDDASTVVLFKDGLAVADCTGPAGTAAPDPCIDSRATLPDGDVELTILTSSASTWAAGVPGPTLGPIATPVGPSRAGAAVAASATLTDAGALGGHLATFDWGDGTTSAGSIPAGATGSALVSASHAYASSGLFTVTLTVTDPSGQSASSGSATVVVFDPAWTVAGSGTVVPGGPTSVSGDILPGLDGSTKAAVALDLRYKKGVANPTGTVTLTYKAFGFAMSVAEWLVVTEGSRARVAGRGTVAGQGGSHPFRLDVVDGNLTAPKRTDRWVLRVWAPGADPDTAEPTYQASGEVKGNLTLKR